MSERLLKLAKVVELTSLSSTEIYRREKKGTFPKRIPISDKRSAWIGSEVDAWIQATIKTAKEEVKHANE